MIKKLQFLKINYQFVLYLCNLVYSETMKGENCMNQIKIGKFISSRRKEKNITQSELAEKLNITDRAISKWENGL